MNKIVDAYKQLTKIASVTEAFSTKNNNFNGFIINSTWSQRNLEINKKQTFIKCFIIDEHLEKSAQICSLDNSKEIMSCVSLSNKLRAVIREEEITQSDTKQLLEIWNDEHLQSTVDLTALDLHGKVYADNEFKTFCFSPMEQQLLYVAEQKQPKCVPFYKRASTNTENTVQGDEFVYRQDWGEQLVGKIQSVICIYNLETDTVKIVDNFPVQLCPGQINWLNNSETSIVGMAYRVIDRKLGLYACTNRLSEIFQFNLITGVYICLSEQNRAVRSPRLTPNNDSIVWLERSIGGPHRTCVALIKSHVNMSSPEILVPIINDSINLKHTQFYGIYSLNLPKRCFSNDGKYLFFSTVQQTRVCSYRLNIDTKELIEIQIETNQNGSITILDVSADNLITAITSNMNTPDEIICSKFDDNKDQLDWFVVTKQSILTNSILDYLNDYKSIELYLKQTNDTVDNNENTVVNFNALYFGPKSAPANSIPLIVLIHGGPHGNFVNIFMLEVALYAKFGYGILLVNYRGSTGTGQNTIDYLCRHVGDADVIDCYRATQECLNKFIELDANRVVAVGGSHGGFLSAHLSGQYPSTYCAVSVRNPVIDIASMSIVSDIPDWSSVNAGGVEYTQKGAINDTILLKQRLQSPIMYAHQVKAPTLLLVGSKDLRVPPSQSIDYYHRLKANGVKTKMHLYDDNHSLAKVPVEFDALTNQMLWIIEHTS